MENRKRLRKQPETRPGTAATLGQARPGLNLHSSTSLPTTSSRIYALSHTLSIDYRGVTTGSTFASVVYLKRGPGVTFHRKNAMKPRKIAVSVPAWYISPPPDRVVVDRGGGGGVLVLVGCGRLVLEGALVVLLI